MDSILLQITTFLSITRIDVWVLVGFLVIGIVFLLIGLQRTYEAFFGLVVGVAIYLMLTVLLSPVYQTADTAKVLWPTLSNFLIGSSAYLIFILFILTPLSGGIRIPQADHSVLRIFEHLFLISLTILFFGALLIGFATKTYIFGINTGFVFLTKLTIWSELLRGDVFGYISRYIQPIVLSSVLFLLYKILFSEIVGAIFFTILTYIGSLRFRRTQSTEYGGVSHGHETVSDEDLFGHVDEAHEDPHGGGGHH